MGEGEIEARPIIETPKHDYYILLKKYIVENSERVKEVEKALKQYGNVKFMDNIGEEHGYSPENWGPGYKLTSKNQLIDEMEKIITIPGINSINIFSEKDKLDK